MNMNRRELLQKGVTLAVGVAVSNGLLADKTAQAFSPSSEKSAEKPAVAKSFPAKFLWGAATAAHQVEGNNVNSDMWLLEHLPRSMYKEPSGDACDHYHLYEQDIRTLADLGFNAYRFSIEWAKNNSL